MDGQNHQYGQYLMYLLGQLMQRSEGRTEREPQSAPGEAEKEKRPEARKDRLAPDSREMTETSAGAPSSQEGEPQYFTSDVTGSRWRREENIDLLEAFCREGYPMARKYGHFLVGTSETANYIGIPGRFLIAEQPAGGKTGFTLWQPLRGGEELYQNLDRITGEEAEMVYGYWIAVIDPKTLKLTEA